jgi:hypothetical protein
LIDHIATLIYTQLHDHYLQLQNELKTANPCHLGQRCRLKDSKITYCEAACLVALFQASGMPHFKQFLDWNRPTLLRLFPNMPSYGRLNVWRSKCEQLMLAFAKRSLADPGDRLSVYLIDSTKIDPHKLKSNPKCLRGKAAFGHTHEGGYIGFKLHVISNRKGQIVAFDLSGANRHDLDPVKGGLLKGLAGVVFADSGYVSAQIRQDLMAKDIAFIAKPTAAMEDLRWYFDKNWAKLYKQRQVVEGVFSRLKNHYGLLANSCRSATSLTVRILASIVAYNLLQPAS